MRWLSNLAGSLLTSFGIGQSMLNAGELTAKRTHMLPDKSGTLALVGDAAYSVGDVKAICHDVIPAGWVVMDGAIYNVADYPQAAALLGDRYGGDGVTTFGVPNAIGRSLRGSAGSDLGETGGSDSVTLTTDQMPSHNHSVDFRARGENVAGAATQPTTTNNVLGAGRAGPTLVTIYHDTLGDAPVALAGVVQSNVGSGQDVDIRNPYLNVTWIVALEVVA
ncbi:tail fiber protein [Pseudomonas chengduensis]